MSGELNLFQLLLDHGARVNGRVRVHGGTCEAEPPAIYAAWKGRDEMLRILLAKGLDLSWERTGVNAMCAAAWGIEDHPTSEMGRILLDVGVKLRAWENASIVRILSHRRKSVPLLQLLLQRGAVDLQSASHTNGLDENSQCDDDTHGIFF